MLILIETGLNIKSKIKINLIILKCNKLIIENNYLEEKIT